MQRPVYHFAPAKNWMNDPNGTVFDGVYYHLFYQYNPFGSEWGNIHWAYARSRDLVNWERGGIRLSPRHEAGEEHCFSGCVYPHADGYKLLYTSVGFGANAAAERAVQAVCAANKDFTAITRRAVIGAQVNPFPVREWRDPFLFSFCGKTYLLLAGKRGGRGCVFLYADEGDLERFSYVGELFGKEGALVECPNAALFGNKMLLLYSVGGDGVHYACGEFDGAALSVREEGLADYGDAFYATNLSGSASGGTVLYGWMPETAPVPCGYSGCLAMPRFAKLRGFTPVFSPVPAFSRLEGELLAAGDPVSRAHIRFSGGELTLRGAAGEALCFAAGGGVLTVRRQGGAAEKKPLSMPFAGGAADIYIDGSAVEVYAGGRAMSLRRYGEELYLPQGAAEARAMAAARIVGE